MFHTLLLNAGYEPLRVVTWRRAFTLVFQEKVEILEEYTESVRSISRTFPVPAVIKLRRWINLKRSTPMIRFSRSNIYLRDEKRCQYCYVEFTEKELTLDHVYPAVRGGKKSWENIVAACMICNQSKGNRTPEEAGLRLYRRPHAPQWLPSTLQLVSPSSAPTIWQPYLEILMKNKG